MAASVLRHKLALERYCARSTRRARSGAFLVLRHGWHSHRAKAPSVNSAFSTIHTASARQEQVKSHSSTVACTALKGAR